ncbi:hypothetical protein COUCH_37850 [Couchioplanes caeruleus]|uniref:hypothetical protein n=1 Tax=Couchioplanes caeruleus TaxID=56438 RepID=UPI0020BFEB56|nr:hypothetical protein [Couchioplanes caeruleus]UQU64639.1 hypothetical protein COUCH_37850 [Couchioplanes caeruleus]
MTTTVFTCLSRDTIRERLDRILVFPASTNHHDDLRAGTHGRAGTTLQFDRAGILLMLHGRDELACAYHQRITDNAHVQAENARAAPSGNDIVLGITGGQAGGLPRTDYPGFGDEFPSVASAASSTTASEHADNA